MEYKILSHLDDPDLRRQFGIPPRRIPNDRKRHLERRLTFPRHGIVWSPSSRALYVFNYPDRHVIMKPVTLDINLDGLYIFNLYEQPYEEAIYWNNGAVLVNPKYSSWATESTVVLQRATQEH